MSSKLGTSSCGRADLQAQRWCRKALGDLRQRFGDLKRVGIEVLHRQPCEVDVNRQARKIVLEQVDRGAALQCEPMLGIQVRKD